MQLEQIPPAKYLITVTAPGFGAQSKSAELLVDQPATVNFALSVKASTQVIDVSAAAQTLNTSDASLGGAADNALIQALPSETRNVPDLLSLQPGVLAFPPLLILQWPIAGAARSMEVVPTRAISRWTVSMTTTRCVVWPFSECCARPRIQCRSSV